MLLLGPEQRKEIAETAAAARDLIKEGWGQGEYVNVPTDGAPEYCIMGAIFAAQQINIDEAEIEDVQVEQCLTALAVRDHLQLTGLETQRSLNGDVEWVEFHKGGWAVVNWNDEEERTQTEVIEVLDQVATKYSCDEYRSGGDAWESG